MKLLDARLTFLDLQTTGATPAGGNLLEIAWCLGSASTAEPDVVQSFLIRQPDEQPIPGRISALTGITNDDMASAIPFVSAKERLDSDLETADVGNTLCIHYAQFERPFLAQAMPEHLEKLRIYCTHQIAARLFPNLPSRGIRGLAGYFGVPIEECKRASSHVRATFIIWQNLCRELKLRGISTFAELDEWLEQTRPGKRTKYEYPLPKSVRLEMPDNPGVYRMLSRTGNILYVGKATSLKSRVNSYFRGQRNRDSRKLEMLTQTWDIRYTVCDTVVQACVLEAEEIKSLSPPYNISLKTGERPLVFYSADFLSASTTQSGAHPTGPFRSDLIMDSFVRLLNSLVENQELDPLMFFDELTQEQLQGGFDEFLARHALQKERIASPDAARQQTARSLLALGMSFLRKYRQELNETEKEDDESADPQLQEEEGERAANSPSSPQEVELTLADIADKYERLLMRAARGYRLARRLTTLLDAEIRFEENGQTHHIATACGNILFKQQDETIFAVGSDARVGEDLQLRWHGLGIQTFDRLRVLDTELSRIRSTDKLVVVVVETQQSR